MSLVRTVGASSLHLPHPPAMQLFTLLLFCLLLSDGITAPPPKVNPALQRGELSWNEEDVKSQLLNLT